MSTQPSLFTPEVDWSPPSSFPELSNYSEVAIDLETNDPLLLSHGPSWAFADTGHITGIAIATKDFSMYFPIQHKGGGNLDRRMVLNWFTKQMSYSNDKVFHNSLYDLGWIKRIGIKVEGTIHDTMFAAPLIDENQYGYSLNKLGKRYLNEIKDETLLKEAAQAYGLDPKKDMWKLPAKYVGQYAEQDAALTLKLWQIFKELLKSENVEKIYQLETGLIPILLDMRYKGVPVDLIKAEEVGKQLKKEEESILNNIKKEHGVYPDLWAAASVATVFDRAGLSYPRSPKINAPSFTSAWLEGHDNKLAKDIGRARKLNKARTTFIDKMILEHSVNGRIHGELHPLRSDTGGTVTGRFSSSNPNLQQVPARHDVIGPMIRSVFVPEPDHHWGCFDYSQQEPRLTVHYSAVTQQEGADDAVDAYRNKNADFHQIVADMANISRKEAKVINLGLSYGMGKDKLISQLDLSPQEAEELFDTYHSRVPFIKGLRDQCARLGANRGYIVTLLGRKCRFNLFEPSFERKTPYPYEEAVERYGEKVKRAFTYKAMNRLIQGSAADMTKKAMVDLYKEGYLPHTQVHDELDISVKDINDCKKIIEIMSDCVSIKVPNLVDAEIGDSWGTAVKNYEDYFNVI
jgi:DNA polymerase I-like protein with 3'-5' exonuclease and polymerase domains